ncbi:hypothetical protein E8D34_17040 [Nocardioides sp. GY 10113]|uniref:site-specific integrase n=1 Tax=Nocardioides sp. GY 10113 TaxID=2569761 RepID=UPI0010A792C4|nr:site-specific integrase [Nocardioides sp. GY 10113]TIC82190.1 hypothetical protein E8D34_17040 [Nocardioides sp. GY 10113]
MIRGSTTRRHEMARPRTPIGTHGKIDIKKQENGTHVAITRYRHADGQNRKVKATGSSPTKAEAALREKCRDLAANATTGAPVRGDTPFPVLAAKWLAQVKASTRLAPTTKERYETALNSSVLPGFEHLTVREVTPGAVHRWHSALRYNRPTARTLLSQIMGLAVLDQAVAINPVAVTPRAVDAKGERRHPKKAMRPHHLPLLRDAITEWEKPRYSEKARRWYHPTVPLRDLVMMSLGTGVRAGELSGVCWHHLDLDAALFRVEDNMTPVKGQGLVRGEVKTKDGARTVTLPIVVVSMLRRRLDEATARAEAKGTDVSPEDPVFASRAGTPLWPRNVARALTEAKAMCTDEDISWITPHTFRRTAATKTIKMLGLTAGASLLGHSGDRIADAHYNDRSAEAVDVTVALDVLLDGFAEGESA